ncbi:MAG: magnesium transporter [Bacteroidetes bacterium]|nr:magnesium transporter [Rhodothermia bacterium]MCS7154837.1 magnesium transporter [Bacteroidota bacterium]MCX7907005.1 magnesium transporter [Bacteroidota bacterium]MDW8137631.1 magnesium transporter [Bacteroidota bacterium]MDW8285415.1 magnesium transporter [Bacteroidota bacterium]
MLRELLGPEIQLLLQQRRLAEVRDTVVEWEPPEVARLVEALPPEERIVLFRLLPRAQAADVFAYLSSELQQELLAQLTSDRIRTLLEELDPDDRTALFEELPGQVTQRLLNLLSAEERQEALRLLGYPEGSVGRLMTPDYVAVRPHWTVDQALRHIRRMARRAETINTVYVVDEGWKLLDEIPLQKLILADPETLVRSLLDYRAVALRTTDSQEQAVALMREYDRTALPVVDQEGVLVGIVTVDDVLDVAVEEATEDIQKFGGMEALDTPYMATPFGEMVKKRAGWLSVLFISEMFTASAMAVFEHAIERVVLLAFFVPLVIASGGNSGSQAATLVIRAMALGEITLRDWWRVIRRELLSGLSLGSILGAIGFLRVVAWEFLFDLYGPRWIPLAFTVGVALIGIVLWGTLIGSMLPFVLRRLGFDPAASSAPFVATLVDVTGIVIYFTVASWFFGL